MPNPQPAQTHSTKSAVIPTFPVALAFTTLVWGTPGPRFSLHIRDYYELLGVLTCDERYRNPCRNPSTNPGRNDDRPAGDTRTRLTMFGPSLLHSPYADAPTLCSVADEARALLVNRRRRRK